MPTIGALLFVMVVALVTGVVGCGGAWRTAATLKADLEATSTHLG